MWPDQVLNPGPLTYESGALPTALRGPAGKEIAGLPGVYEESSTQLSRYPIICLTESLR